jgi:hypothetical protein
MKWPEVVFLTTWPVGVVLLVFGRLTTRLRWRSEAPPFHRGLSAMELMLRPGKYAVLEALPLIRTLNLAGSGLMAAGLAALIYGLITTLK